jgi:hypothetical protein
MSSIIDSSVLRLLRLFAAEMAKPDLSRRSFSEGRSSASGMLTRCAVHLTWWGLQFIIHHSSFILHPSSFPLPSAYGFGDGAKPPENRQNSPVAALHQLWQDGAGMNESEKQFSFTRAASSTSGRAKNQTPNH